MEKGGAHVDGQSGSYGYRKDEIKRRLSLIEGQVRGLGRMVEQEKYCVDILTQVAAVQAALNGVSVGVLRDHVKGCVSGAQGSEQGETRLDELVDVLERFMALRR